MVPSNLIVEKAILFFRAGTYIVYDERPAALRPSVTDYHDVRKTAFYKACHNVAWEVADLLFGDL